MSAAIAVVLCCVCRDPLLLRTIQDPEGELWKTLLRTLRIFFAAGKCELVHLAGLYLLHVSLVGCGFGFAESLADEVMPLMLDLLAAQRRDNTITELSLMCLGTWAQTAHRYGGLWPAVMKIFNDAASLSGKLGTHHAFSQLLRQISVTFFDTRTGHLRVSYVGLLINHSEHNFNLARFLLACQRSNSAGDRLAALRSIFHSKRIIPPATWHADRVSSRFPLDRVYSGDLRDGDLFSPTAPRSLVNSDAARFCQLRDRFYREMQQFCSHKNYQTLSQALSTIIVEDPAVVTFSHPASLHFHGGRPPTMADLPFQEWDDVLTVCITALERTSERSVSQPHQAELLLVIRVLTTFDHLVHQRWSEAVAIAKPIAEDPTATSSESHIWFCYVLACSSRLADITKVYTILSSDYSGYFDYERDIPVRATAVYRALLFRIASVCMDAVLCIPLEDTMRTWYKLSYLLRITHSVALHHIIVAPMNARYSLAMLDIWFLSCTLADAQEVRDMMDIVKDERTKIRQRHNVEWNHMITSAGENTVNAFIVEYDRAVEQWSTALKRHIPIMPHRDTRSSDEPQAIARWDIYLGTRTPTRSQIDAWRGVLRTGNARLVSWSDAPRELLTEILLLDYPDVSEYTCGSCGTSSSVSKRCVNGLTGRMDIGETVRVTTCDDARNMKLGRGQDNLYGIYENV
ncbi:hypothetical protein EXIGLDRAFT_775375 [Exidia glandulosa HHB12029]|uniref:Uncharacterized protein n=1 Tax=Exidia glandulosa HHB12029 TaxID=1314781 RepID=A0A165DYA3_EXIGL|nr:hypothetical protein EXIGLDRAFT_775375 [Exidia glandulosa HHB12029]